MSLKVFHVVFIVLSTALAIMVGVWAAQHTAEGGLYPVLAVGGFVAAVALVVYGVWFLRKTRDVDPP